VAAAICRAALGPAPSAGVPPAAEAAIRGLAGGGQPLPQSVRDFFEPRFGADFRPVRVHMGTAAGNLAAGLQARAFTVGRDIFFGQGQYSPGTQEGTRLLAHELTHVVQQSGRPGKVGAGVHTRGQVQREVKPPESQPSYRLRQLAQTAIDELDGDRSKKLLLQIVISAKKLSETAAFARLLKAKSHRDFGDYFIFLITELEQDYGSKTTVEILKWFADEGVDVVQQLKPSGVQALAAVAKFKSLLQHYQALLHAGKISASDQQRINALIQEAQTALRSIEHPHGKPGVQVKRMGGIAIAAGVAWKTAGALAADDLTGIGVADDIAIPFVIVAAAVLSGIALFSGGPKPPVLDYGPALTQIHAALLAMTTAMQVAEPRPRPIPVPPPPLPGRPPTEKREPPSKEPPREAPVSPRKTPTKTIDIIPTPPTQTEPEERRRRRCRRDPCPTPLPIKWPSLLPLPAERRPLVRTPQGDWNLSPDQRSQPQRDLQREIEEARKRNVPPPRPCFRHDAEPNAPYDAHHIHPLFLGGAEDEKNLCALRADYHQKGHPRLYNQHEMLSDAVWLACRICEGNLRRHPGGQEYYISGRK